MIKELETYLPEKIDFCLPKGIVYPPVLFQGVTDIEKVRELVHEMLVATNETSERAFRKLDAYEIKTIRFAYCEMLENEEPKLEENLAELQ